MNLGLPLMAPIAAKPPDPLEAYLHEKSAPAEPDLESYLREKRMSDMAAKTGSAESFGRGAAQGATLGFGDEAAASYGAAQKQIERMPELRGVPDADLYATAMADSNDYHQQRDAFREQDEAARRAHSKTFLAGELVGGAAPTAAVTAATGGAAALPMSVAQGAAQGLGYSNASTARGLAGDTVLGAGFGALGHGVGEAVGAAGRGVASLARSKVAAASGRAASQATEEANSGLASLSNKYGAEVQKGSRYVENLMRLEESMTPEQQALFKQLQASGVVPDLQRQVAQSTLERLPGQAATIAERKAAMEAAQSALPQTIAARTQELSQPQILKDAVSLAKSYGEPLAAAALAPAGMKTAAGLIFGRTRAGKAIANRLARPGNQIAAFGALENAAEAANSAPMSFLRKAILQSSVPEMIPAQ